MQYKSFFFLFLFVLCCSGSQAQKPFAEGTIVYKVRIRSADNKEFTGTYTFIIKGGEIKKELKLDNGYQDVVLLNCTTGKAYSLQDRNGKKYAIQLNIDDLAKKQEKFNGYTVRNEEPNNAHFAGYAAYKGNISYHDGTASDVTYIKEWRPTQAITFERFPDAKFLPVLFSYEDENKMVMDFEIEKIAPAPVENATFRIPPDYKMISYSEYKQLSR
jgi:hypothetical protein